MKVYFYKLRFSSYVMVATIFLIPNSRRFQEIPGDFFHFSRSSERQIPGDSRRFSNFFLNFQDFQGGSKIKFLNVTESDHNSPRELGRKVAKIGINAQQADFLQVTSYARVMQHTKILRLKP